MTNPKEGAPPVATVNPRNLVLLLSSGHTVRIALRDDDLPTTTTNADSLHKFIRMLPAVPMLGAAVVAMAYIEDPSLPMFDMNSTTYEPVNDLQRITVERPGAVYGG